MNQLDSTIGFKKEAVFGTGVTVDRFPEFTEETFDVDRGYYQGKAQRVGSRLPRSARRVMTSEGAKGDLSMEVPTRGIGALLELALGVGVSSQVAAGPVYQQLFTMIKNDFLPSATIQKGIPQLGTGIIETFTGLGMVCSGFELGLSGGEVLTLKTSWMGRELVRDVAYAAATYPDFELFSFVGAALTVGGTVTVPTATELAVGGTEVANVRDFNFTFTNGLDTNGRNMGGGGKLSRKPAAGVAEGKGKLTAEFDSTIFSDAVLDQDDFALVATFVGPTAIDTDEYPTLQLVLPCIRFESELPKAGTGDVITHSLDFTVFDDLAASEALYVAVRTADTAL